MWTVTNAAVVLTAEDAANSKDGRVQSWKESLSLTALSLPTPEATLMLNFLKQGKLNIVTAEAIENGLSDICSRKHSYCYNQGSIMAFVVPFLQNNFFLNYILWLHWHKDEYINIVH